jgi:hypothetical protein
MMRSLAILCVLCHFAHADKQGSLTHYEKGKSAYAAGRFEEAAAEFERAYAAWSAAEYLHDIAQAYRRLDRCPLAATHFERYLAAKPDAPNRTAVEGHIQALRAKCPSQPTSPSAPTPGSTSSSSSAPRDRATASAPAPARASGSTAARAAAQEPATAPARPPAASTASAGTASMAMDGGAASAASQPVAAPHTGPTPPANLAHVQRGPAVASTAVVSTTAASIEPSSPSVTYAAAPPRPRSPWQGTGRATLLLLDAGPVVMPAVPELAAGVLREVASPLPVDLRVGANLSLARLPYADRMSGTVWLGGPELVASGSLSIRHGLQAFVGVAAGAHVIAGLGEDNPFTSGGVASPPLMTARTRVELGAAWRASDRLTVLFVPLGYNVTLRRSVLADDIPALHGLAMHAGVSVEL